jgi:hypothetical protein
MRIAEDSFVSLHTPDPIGAAPMTRPRPSLPAAALAGAQAVLVAPRPEDSPDDVALRLTDGKLVAITNTCAAVARGIVGPTDHAAVGADRDAARAAFAVAA